MLKYLIKLIAMQRKCIVLALVVFLAALGAARLPADESPVNDTYSNTLPGKAWGGRLFPPFALSLGGGLGFEEGFLNFRFSDADKQSGLEDYSANTHYLYPFAFIDAVYAMFETGASLGWTNWDNTPFRSGT